MFSEIDDAHIAYAGTFDDTIVIPNGLTTNSTGEQTSWGEIYLNDGDDNLTLPDTFYIDGDTDNPNTSFLYYTYLMIIQGGSGNDYILVKEMTPLMAVMEMIPLMAVK